MNKILYVPESIYLLIRIKPKKRHHHTALVELYESISPTHKEQGCQEYKVIDEKDSIIVFGRWKSKMALDMHLLFQYHLKLFEETLPPMCKKISIKTYQEIEPPITSLSLS